FRDARDRARLADAGDGGAEIGVRVRALLELVQHRIAEELPPRSLRDRVARRRFLPGPGFLPRRGRRRRGPLVVRPDRATQQHERDKVSRTFCRLHLGGWGSTFWPSRIVVDGLAITQSCSSRPPTTSISVPKSRPTWILW